MIDVTQSVPMSFIVETIGAIFAMIAVGVLLVIKAKRTKENR
ncbi:MAG: hypothetical protein Q8M39_00835 [Sulfuricurvum sp.]|nr:hypothetical protein [Sulfuricurvum sp.]